MIQQNLRQYTTLRHETDMFNQSVSHVSISLTVQVAVPLSQLYRTCSCLLESDNQSVSHDSLDSRVEYGHRNRPRRNIVKVHLGHPN